MLGTAGCRSQSIAPCIGSFIVAPLKSAVRSDALEYRPSPTGVPMSSRGNTRCATSPDAELKRTANAFVISRRRPAPVCRRSGIFDWGGRSMIRLVFIAGVIGLGIGVALAQEDPIAARKALMKANGEAAKTGAAMMKGEAPFDLDKARKVFATFENAGEKAPALFPDDFENRRRDRRRSQNLGELAGLQSEAREARRRRQGRRRPGHRPRQLQGRVRQYRQERLRLLPPDLSREEKLKGDGPPCRAVVWIDRTCG